MFAPKFKLSYWAMGLIAGLILCGIVFRFYKITDNQFIFYDEGYYLNYNLSVLKMIAYNPEHSLGDILKEISAYIRVSLRTGKALFFLLSDVRVFWGGLESWFFPRVVAAVCGTLTLLVTFIFAKRFFDSKWVGFLSVALLSILPGHVFYSRVGLQETLAALLFVTGFYLYVFPRKFGLRTFLSAVAFAGAYFSNYRLIILPAIVFFCEAYLSLAEQRWFDFRKYLWNTLIFLLLLFVIGGLYNAENTSVTFSWMFHQQDLASQQGFAWINLLSYPYYLFRLENIFFGLAFFANIYYLLRRRWREAFFFCLVLFVMLCFSFSPEKGARYLCVAMPLMAMAVAYLIWDLLKQKVLFTRAVAIILVGLLTTTCFLKSLATAQIKTDYEPAMQFLTELDANIKVQSTQPWVMNLYASNKKNVISCPRNYRYFLMLYSQGYRYLVIDPQAYISWTKSERHFDPQLEDFLQFILHQVPPMKSFSHFSPLVMERFVFDHNQNLSDSVQFLNLNKDNHLGQLRVYNIRQCLAEVNRRATVRNLPLEGNRSP